MDTSPEADLAIGLTVYSQREDVSRRLPSRDHGFNRRAAILSAAIALLMLLRASRSNKATETPAFKDHTLQHHLEVPS